MSAELIIRSEIPPISWGAFTTEYPGGSIALDGFVDGPPQFDPNGPYLNADHHKDVDRLSTLSSAQQIALKLQMKMAGAFSHDGVFDPKVFANDCDEDVATAWWALTHLDRILNQDPAVERFLQQAGRMDVTAGAFPYGMETLEQLAWVFDPYAEFRLSGEKPKKDNAQYRSIVDAIGERITRHVDGDGESVTLDTRYELEGGGEGWSMIREIGRHARLGVLMEMDAYVFVEGLPDDADGSERHRYTIGRSSEFIPFPLPVFVETFNEMEGCEGGNEWGGSGQAIGSPRVGGSRLLPVQVVKGINEKLAP
jgi:hypothetical protein